MTHCTDLSERLTERQAERILQVEALAERDNERRIIRDRTRERAIRILENANPVKYILYTFKTQHIGDIETAEGILVGAANQCIANSKGIQPAVYGESGMGKSHAVRAMLHLFPASHYMVTSLSDKALFYMEANELRPGMTIFSDDAKISDGIEGIIKRSTAFFQEPTLHKVASKDGGKWTARTLKIPGRINWLLTSVDSQGTEQLINRQIGFGIDVSEVQDDAVTAFELEKARDGMPEFSETEEVLTCRELLVQIKEDELGNERLFTVKIPFAKRIEWRDRKNRRNLPIFLDMVKGYTVLNFMQRKTVDGALIATEDDFKAAAKLYNSRGGFQKLHVTDREKDLLMVISDNGGELTADELMGKLRLSRARIRAIAERLETVLPSFYVEKRSESAQDPSDTGKHTVTQRNYYVYSGDVTLDAFDSVVSLRKPTPEEVAEETTYTGYTPDTPPDTRPSCVSGP
ncbi:MAG: hypothetical protein WBZ42_10830, partial [Halobacteriota archaeon]